VEAGLPSDRAKPAKDLKQATDALAFPSEVILL
jgi:hypothetical protein